MLAVAPISAEDHSPWVYRSSPPTLTHVELAERQDACCKHCTEGRPQHLAQRQGQVQAPANVRMLNIGTLQDDQMNSDIVYGEAK